MLLKQLSLHSRGQQEENVQVSLDFVRILDVRRDENNNVTAMKLSTSNDFVALQDVSNNRPKFVSFDPDTYYLLIDGSLTIKKDRNQDVTINPTYQSSTFTDYKDLWKPLSNQPVKIVMGEDAKLLSFSIKDDSYPWANSVKAATVTDATFNLEANDNSFVIVVGNHKMNGVSSEEEEQDLIAYKVGGPEGNVSFGPHDEVLAPGPLTIEANGICNIIYIEK